ncbi:conidial yellow pigment biosynthesis polyketide synthase [Aspergillus udagawae]|nr:conidial yellow pigment biosynthesis polyketide synthase [Aspergillus udagawae]
MPSTHILAFPHEHADLLGAIYDMNVRSKTRSQLRTFLSAASAVVREQVDSLDGPERGRVGSFEDLVDLAEQFAKQQHPSVVAEIVLFTTVQMGQLLILAEDNSSILSGTTDDVVLPVGFGIGLIAASIAATVTSTDAIIALGLQGIRIAVRLAVLLERTGRAIQDSNGIWACAVSGFSEKGLEQQLENVNSTLGQLHQAYVGQVLPGSVVLFGPPSTLDTLAQGLDLDSELTRPDTLCRCPMYGSHLPPLDVDQVVGAWGVLELYQVKRPLYSAHTSTSSLPANTLVELLRRVVVEIAHKPMHIENTVSALAAAIEASTKDDAVLTTVGSTWDASTMQDLLLQHGQTVSLGEFPSCPTPFGSSLDSIPPDAIAVVGMSGRFPESDTLDEFWRLLETGKTTHQEIPCSRFSVDDFYDPSRSKHNALLARHGCFIKKPGDFDHRLFNISPREALQMDPVQRMLLMTTYEALEMAGYAPPSAAEHKQFPPRIATYFGQTTDDWKTINEQQGIDTHFLPGVNRGFAPGRLSHYFQWAGGFYAIDTGCSSSATAVCLARDALTAGKYDAAVVGGGTLLTAPEWFAGLSQGGFLSPTGACKTYSDRADGYCRGEGVAVVVLKRLSDAIRNKDNVLAVIAGASRNCNAGAGSITYPGEEAQAALYRRVLRQAAVHPHAVNVIEMHGTGTQAGDRVEMHAVRSVFASQEGPRRPQPLIAGAVKAAIGHSEAAAGVVSLIKAILILQRNSIPPQPDQPFTLNPHLVPLLGSEIQLANGQSWPPNGTTPRYVFVNNFDAAGGNVSMIIHDPPSFALPGPPRVDDRQFHVVAMSGRTETALEANKSRLQQYLTQHPDTRLSDLAYTTTARRMHHVHRDAHVASSTAELLRQLERPVAANNKSAQPMPASSVVFAFTGQGSQYVGMGGTLYRTSPTVRTLLDSYQTLCRTQGLDCQFLDAIRGSSSPDVVPSERDMQVATVALEIALAQYWQSLGLRPTLLIGHSLGEYAALCIAGVLSVADALALAHERATLIFSRCTPSESGMLAVGFPVRTIQWRLRDSAATAGCEVCCVNGPSSTVVGGPITAIEAFENYLKSEESNGKVATTRLRVPHAFHTQYMDPVLDDLETSAARVSFRAPTVAVASTLLGRVVQPGEDDVFNAQYMRRHTREPVVFMDAVRACEVAGLIQEQSFVVEIGPHPTCVTLMAACLERVSVNAYPSLRRGRDDWESVSECLAAAYRAQLPVDWTEFHKDHLDNLRLLPGLPTYAFDMKSFWQSYKTKKSEDVPDLAGRENSRLSSTSLHSVLQLRKEEGRLLGTFAVDLTDRQLAEAIGGHVVDGVAICPASIFIDMAYTAASYLARESSNSAVPHASLTTYELADLRMQSPLVLRDSDPDVPRVEVESVLDKSKDIVSIRFLSHQEASSVEYGSCVVRLSQLVAPHVQTWSRLQPLVKARVQSLHDAVRPREVHTMDRRLFYKIFSEIVDYSAPYHAVEEATVAADFRDASIILLPTPAGELGNFACNPVAVDAMIHVAGFLLNADVKKPKNDVHIANHIGSLCVLGDLSPNKPYMAYATIRQQDAKTGTSLCDVYVVDNEDRLVALCTDICFKKLDRDFFALLTGSTRAPQAKPRPTTSAKRGSQAQFRRAADSISSSGISTPASSVSLTSSQSSIPDAVNLAVELFEVVATRSGISVAELKGSTGMTTTFSDMGVDSQMSIAILADFQKATGVELPAAFFTNFPTPAAVEKELASSQPVADLSEPVPEHTIPMERSKDLRENARSRTGPAPSQQLFALVAHELGLEGRDLTPTTTFESIGMDSMLSIKITAAFQDKTQIELPAAFFTDHRTVAAAQEALDGPLEILEPTSKEPPMSQSEVIPAVNRSPTEATSSRQQKIDNAVSRAVLIQGQSRSRAAPLFLTTDGSGTVESYIHLKPLLDGRRIYALDSPFVDCPENFDLSIQEMATIFLRTIRRIQPRGPYLIGGWSAGSMYAYEVAHRLTMQGETIASLIILDMRAPSLISTAIVTEDFVDKLGTFEGINRARELPEDLTMKERMHLLATCRALSRYDAPAFAKDRQPRHIAVVWAKLGLDNREDAPIAAMSRPGVDIGKRLEEMSLQEFERYFNSWFYGKRLQFGTNGWETLLGDHIEVHTVDGDHFSMMAPPFSEAVGTIVADTVARAVAEIGL